MQKSHLKCFGVGDGWPSARRHHSAYLYQFEKGTILIDCGEPFSSSYKASGLDYDLVDALLLSHLHFDHVGGFFMMIQGFWLEQRQKDLPVYLPSDGIVPIRGMLAAANIFDDLLAFRLSFEALKGQKSFQVRDVRITPHATTHLAGLKKSFQDKYPFAFEAFSFLLESGSVRVGHSGDIGAVEDLVPLTEKPLDLLVCEIAHTRPDELFDFLAQRPIQKIFFTHLTNGLWDHLEKIRGLAQAKLSHMDYTFVEDGEEIVF